MTTDTHTQNGTALAVREWTDEQLQTRIRANINARFGLHEASPAQLNIVYLLARRWGLDPVNELTLYEGRPFITIDGRLQLMRRHPDYRGYRTRPLSKDEKESWGYETDDLVVEATIVTKTTGEITARGCVRRDEIERARRQAQENGKRSAPIGRFGPEIAEKRAIARASRAAFGQDVPDEDDAGYVIEERESPEKLALDAARYTEIYGTDEDPEPAQSERLVTSKNSKPWKNYAEAAAMAREAGAEFDDVELPVSEAALKASTQTLLEFLQPEPVEASF